MLLALVFGLTFISYSAVHVAAFTLQALGLICLLS